MVFREGSPFSDDRSEQKRMTASLLHGGLNETRPLRGCFGNGIFPDNQNWSSLNALLRASDNLTFASQSERQPSGIEFNRLTLLLQRLPHRSPI